MRISKTDEEGALSRWIEALGVDASYRPPPERREKPVACFYVLCQNREKPENQSYHRVIYLMKRTLEEFNGRIASKWGLEVPRIQRTIRVIRDGLEVEMDDDVVRELKEGQDMRLEVEDTTERRWSVSGDASAHEAMGKASATKSLILRLRT